MGRTAIIIGGGPAGLTAAWELLKRTDITPIVIELSDHLGGLARTVNYKGNRIDIGGHRFFSKSDRVMNWWLNMMPLQRIDDEKLALGYQGGRRDLAVGGGGPDPDAEDRVMLVRSRKSRIYWNRKLFDYPLNLSLDTLRKMGLMRTVKVGLSYARASVLPIRPETTLQDFLTNRFGGELYETFFKSYTQKVWGVPCQDIPADWGAQRIKGVSIRRAIAHALRPKRGNGIAQKGVETSLIEQFLYPKHGPGQMWDITGAEVEQLGGRILMQHRAEGCKIEGDRIVEVTVRDLTTDRTVNLAADYVFSTMPVRHLLRALQTEVPDECRRVAEGLMYRDFFTVGLLVDAMKLATADGEPVRDNWIYIQEPDVMLGRLQLFHNWSPYLVADRSKFWLGLEYFCYDTDPVWSQSDEQLVDLGADELTKLGVIDRSAVRDGCVIRMKKTYPAYFGTYDEFNIVRDYLNRFDNLYCLGRNGQHRYNNQDHSMLTAMLSVDNILEGRTDKTNIWEVNTEQDYHEMKEAAEAK